MADESCFSNGYLETTIDWIPGMRGIRLRDMPTFIRTTDPDDIMLNYNIVQHENAGRSTAVVFNTFDELEADVLEAIQARFSDVYTVGPLQLVEKEINGPDSAASIGSNLWKEDLECLKWLDGQEAESVLYINFGSITPLSAAQMAEFAWGLAGSGRRFLWVIRPDLVAGKGAVLPEGFAEETEGRGMTVGWCRQEAVLAHAAVGGFLTHCGWNSTLEAVAEGVPMVCWPFFAEQQTNCRYACSGGAWGVGAEIEGEVTRWEVERVVRMVMEGEKGKEMRRRAVEWKIRARAAAARGGSSYENLERLVNRLVCL